MKQNLYVYNTMDGELYLRFSDNRVGVYLLRWVWVDFNYVLQGQMQPNKFLWNDIHERCGG